MEPTTIPDPKDGWIVGRPAIRVGRLVCPLREGDEVIVDGHARNPKRYSWSVGRDNRLVVEQRHVCRLEWFNQTKRMPAGWLARSTKTNWGVWITPRNIVAWRPTR